ncbi:peroxidase-like [Ischnura elegans]|uniref:peroxidase-like n=1 Tax=Ischnura elegans TaxID=197161 RepID=UPI001ED88688|nr:peroxidase-like [Ischnura elegans]
MIKHGLLGAALLLLAHTAASEIFPINLDNSVAENNTPGEQQDAVEGKDDAARWNMGHHQPLHPPDFSPHDSSGVIPDLSMSDIQDWSDSKSWSDLGSHSNNKPFRHDKKKNKKKNKGKRRNTPKPNQDSSGSHQYGSDEYEEDSGDDESEYESDEHNSDGYSSGSHSSGDRSGSHSSGDRSGSHSSGDRSGSHSSGDRSGGHSSGDRSGSYSDDSVSSGSGGRSSHSSGEHGSYEGGKKRRRTTTRKPKRHYTKKFRTTTTAPPTTATESGEWESREKPVCVKPPPILHKRENNPNSIPIYNTRSHGRVCGVRWNRCTCHKNPYRTYDGTCNNLRSPDSGIPNIPLTRVVPARYCDGIRTPRRSRLNDRRLPSARKITSTMFDTKNVKHPHLTQLTAIFWIFVATDIFQLKRRDVSDSLQCCSPEGRMVPQKFLPETCLAIRVAKNDSFFSQFNQRCIHFERSGISQECREDPHRPIEQVNLQTSFLDLAVIYGNSERENRKLRVMKHGLMKMKRRRDKAKVRPHCHFLPNVEDAMRVCGAKGRSDPCYYTPNPQTNKIVTIAALQTIFVREHNRIARKLCAMHPDWEDEDVFQQARKIMIGIYHNMIYNQWLKLVVGIETQKKLKLPFFKLGPTYDANINPGAMNDLAGCVFSLSTTMIPSVIFLMDAQRHVVKKIDLIAAIDDPSALEKPGGMDAVAIGLTAQNIQAFDNNFIKEVIKLTLASEDGKMMAMDLIATDIQSGRDLGISTYNDARVLCGYPRAKTFQEFEDTILPEAIANISCLYAVPDDVDLFTALAVEKPYDEGLVGPIASCLIGEQFYRLRAGDRFFTAADGCKHSFTKEQLEAILATSFSSLICSSADGVTHMQSNPFIQPSPANPLRSCQKIPKLDLRPWSKIELPPKEC